MQPKLSVSAPGDADEREADAIADRVMRMTTPGAEVFQIGRSAPADLARACGGCDGLDEDDSQIARKPRVPAVAQLAARTAADAVASGGRPLEPADRAFFEPRFGRDLGEVRIHTNARASRAAVGIEALAFTHKKNIAFAEGQYQPGTENGRHLLAHELTHTLQQSAGAPLAAGGRDATESVRQAGNGSDAMIYRACSPVGALPGNVRELSAGEYLMSSAAERCLQTQYALTHPISRIGVSLSFNKDWVDLTGGSVNEKMALSCLRGRIPGSSPNFTGKSGMVAGEPDIWDFRNQTMYEITTKSGASFRITKLGLEIAQANAVTAGMDCGGLQFDRGTWDAAPVILLEPNLYMTTVNQQGVLTYTLWTTGVSDEDWVRIVAILGMLSSRVAPQAAKQAAGKAVPIVAAASAAAMAVMLVSGKAQAKAGPGDEEPIVQLFQAMAQKGAPVSPEMQRMIEADPALKKKIEDSMTGKGSPTEAQKALTEATMKMIEANPDQFSAQDLETLVSIQEASAAAGVDGAPQSVEKLRGMLDAVRHGKKASSANSGSGASQGAGAGKTSTSDRSDSTTGKAGPGSGGGANALASVTGPRRRVLDSILSKGGGGPSADPVINDLIAALPPDLTDAEADQLISNLQAVSKESAQAVLVSIQAGVAALRQSKAAKPGGLDSGATAALAEAAKLGANVPLGMISATPPEVATVGKTYGLQIVGRQKNGQSYACMATVRIDKKEGNTISGAIVANSDGVGVNGAVVIAAGSLVGHPLSTAARK